MSDLVVRRATPADYASAGAVTVAAYDPFTGDAADDDYVARLADAASRDAEAELWVATTDEGTLLGCVTICPPGSRWREIARDDEGEFRMLAVAPDAQGRGVGRALVGLVLDRFRDDGASAVALSSLREMTAAHRLYERLGFTRLPERDWKPRPEVDLIAFRKEL
ncbi:MAG TPA: GNAT family N-acetyltransferase [Nocardioides sp.]|uniref:GNAT family N-acetyltransferase n=1 Tax=Nocardioides sp. TaxID=35761 RepID=UPI002CB064FC|nr:GNAT family N-acetyltransferase [Nocardioides sp.]HTW14178.1 GNAT family N-acetyltransferase [Nocardioides sp.]